MVKINYQFADGHTEEIEVTEEVAEFLNASQKEEHALEERERYHTGIYLDAGEYEGMWYADKRTPDYFYNLSEEEERVNEFMETLTEVQRRRLQIKLDNPEYPLSKIAELEHICVSKIYKTFEQIKKKFQLFYFARG